MVINWDLLDSMGLANVEKHQAQKLGVDPDKERIWNMVEKRAFAKLAFVHTNTTLIYSHVCQLHQDPGKNQGLLFKRYPQ